jgi:signal transduction histidine kinase
MLIMRDVTASLTDDQIKMHSHFMDMVTATISHDLKTPLNAILGVTKMMGIQKASCRCNSHDYSKSLKIVINSASLLNSLVDDLIDLFKIRSG